MNDALLEQRANPDGPPGVEIFPYVRAVETKPKARFSLIPFEEIKLKSGRAYLVKDILPAEGLIIIWGPPKCGKTFWTFDLAMHVALGRLYRGRKVTQGAVVYIACEGERGLAARVEAWRRRHLGNHADAVPFHLLTTRLDLAADHEELIRDIRAQIGDAAIVLIVIDTLNRSLNGSESDDEDMGAYVKAADAIREAFTTAVAIIHHCGIEGTRPRGHTSLTGAADAQLAVKRNAAGTINTIVEWMKDGTEGTAIASTLDTVEVGTDDDGEAITSCVVVETDAPPPGRGPRLTPAAEVALEALREAIIDHGELSPQALKTGQNGLSGKRPGGGTASAVR